MNIAKANITNDKSNDTYSNRIYNYCLKYAATRNSLIILFFVAFADASFLPLPTPFIFIAMMLLNLKKAYWFAFYGSIGTITGSLLGYAIGYYMWNTQNGEYTQFAEFMFRYIPGFDVTFHQKVKNLYDSWGTGVLLVAPYVPLPYKIFSISSGIFEINLFTFLVSTIIGQSTKFYLTSFLTRKFGYKILPFINTHLKTVSFILLLIIIIIVIFKFI
jgi:membrane protein YqaA with SNARE-associated domain